MTTACFYDERCLTHDNGSMVLDEHASRWLDVPLPAGSGDAGYLLAWDEVIAPRLRPRPAPDLRRPGPGRE